MPNPNSKFDPKKSLDLTGRVLLSLRSCGADRQVIDLLQTASDRALKEECVVLSRLEKQRLLKEVANSILGDLPDV